ncbi:hypothetical protein K1719_011870 [Acacia pycnantha]|nr:hypothetical protein K1719_011870 [Acacia pycnantha]
MSHKRAAADSALSADGDGSAGEIMLFGVRVVVDSMRKSVSMNNLSQYEHPQDATNNNNGNKEDSLAAGYASADEAAAHNSGRHRERERKRGVPWTEEEHKLFLLGLQKVGKGDWRGISRNYVKTRTPTQVASHAQKYFLRRSNLNRRRRRSSLFDITTDTVSAIPIEEQIQHQDYMSLSNPVCPGTPETTNINGFAMMPVYPMNIVGSGMISVPAVSHPKASESSNITSMSSSSSADPPSLSLGLSLSSDQRQTSTARHSSILSMPCFNNGDNIISVA